MLLEFLCRISEPGLILAVIFYLSKALAYSDPNSDGAVTVQREIGDHVIILTIFAMQI